ncbi:hypothetical protein AMECASPLE_019795 [Ameca splendens]|uniref:Epidermal growth factor receptor substrate 15 n=1 Tax=Ameca splendens TaxID=208324 RepID=A0ABV0Z155_9TELE
MAALMTLSQLSNGSAAYENYYRQLDLGNTGRISAGDAAQFLKKSGLSDSTLGKIWDLADSDRKGYLDKRGFFIAMRLVASAQGGNEISLNNLNQNVAAPKFRDTDSPLLTISSVSDWAIRPDEKGKFEAIFESLSPVKGLLSGDKVRPVLVNSKLPLDVLGKIWDLSDVDKDGHLDKDEFTVAMHLVYRTMESEPVPSSLPSSLIPPSKRKKSAPALPGAVAVLPTLSGLGSGPAALKEALRSSPSLRSATPPMGSVASAMGGVTPLSSSTVNLSPKHSFNSSSASTPVAAVNWVVPVADREKYRELFKKTDTDGDGFITGTEIIEIFMQSNLSQSMLAQIWGLADTKQTGKLTPEQFALAMHFIQQKVTKGIDPPSALTSDMIPPSERTAGSAMGLSFMGILPSVRPDLVSTPSMRRDSTGSIGSVELTGNKELDDLSQEIAQLQREKFFLEQEIREKEETIRQKNSDVQVRRRKDEEPLVDCIHKEETLLLGKKNLCRFPPTPGIDVVFDRQINPLIFSYQTDFQLSSSSGNGLVEQKFACELCLSRYAPPIRCPVTGGKWPETLHLSRSILPVTSELRRLLSCVRQNVRPKWMAPSPPLGLKGVINRSL